MSWLKNAVSKVGEKAEAIKQSERFQRLQEKTSEVVATAAEKYKHARERIGRPASAIEFEAQLENRAKATSTLPGLVELHKSWTQSLIAAANKEGPKVTMGEHELTFKEMLLQSRALEFTLEAIVSDPTLRENYVELTAPDDKSSPLACLSELLSKTLVCSPAEWSGIIKVAMSGGLPGEQQVNWLCAVITSMKCDWNEEVLNSERKDLALKAEYLRQEIKQLDGSEDDEQLQKRTALSAELLETYSSVRHNLEDAQLHRQEVQTARASDLKLLSEQIQAHIAGLESSSTSSTVQQKHLEGELNQSQDSIKLQLQHMDEVRANIDKEIDDLDERKRRLRIELDDVSRQLDEARMKQKQHMEKCDKQREELHALKSSMKEKIDSANQDVAKAENEKKVLESTKQMVHDVDGLLQQSLGDQLEDLSKKKAHFQEHFQLLLAEHLRYAQEQAGKLRSRAEAAMASQDPAERKAVLEAGQAAQEALGAFGHMHLSSLASSGAEAQLEQVKGAHEAIISLLDESIATSAAPVDGVVPPAAAEPAANDAMKQDATSTPATGPSPAPTSPATGGPVPEASTSGYPSGAPPAPIL
mmetsp:Transcript_52244/g.93714  ORF Transcript_52244/g.93714 Transcript_52244/m.93714 type:complete len:587 (+) Transcript_52244:25-1785(+)